MGKVVNFRVFRKRLARLRDEQRAAENRLQHGTPKGERLLAKLREAKATRNLDQHRIDKGEGR